MSGAESRLHRRTAVVRNLAASFQMIQSSGWHPRRYSFPMIRYSFRAYCFAIREQICPDSPYRACMQMLICIEHGESAFAWIFFKENFLVHLPQERKKVVYGLPCMRSVRFWAGARACQRHACRTAPGREL
jgi:hypothetical protein